MRRLIYPLVLAACGGPPVLSHLPRPDPAVVAGIAAGAAAAATLANPSAAGRPKEKERPLADKKPIKVRETMPPEVLDRLDRAEQQADAGTTSPAP